jgi:hypothetical protein
VVAALPEWHPSWNRRGAPKGRVVDQILSKFLRIDSRTTPNFSNFCKFDRYKCQFFHARIRAEPGIVPHERLVGNLGRNLILGISNNLRILAVVLLGAVAQPLSAQQAGQQATLKYLPLNEPDGEILSYRYQAGASDVRLQGTKRAPKAHIKLKIGSRPGFVELDINRGVIYGLEPAQHFGKDFLTYVLWAVSVDGRAANLGEITFNGQTPVSINVTTPYQTFWLMVTAEPDYAVADPSSVVVLYSVGQNGEEETPDKHAQKIEGKLAYYTHYTRYDDSPNSPQAAPNELLQARKALELALKAGIPAGERRGQAVSKDENQITTALNMASTYLKKAEAAFSKDPKGSDVVQYSRTSAQIAENARALSLGAVGDVAVRRLEDEVKTLQSELQKFENGKVSGSLSEASAAARPLLTSYSERQTLAGGSATNVGGITGKVKQLASQPITWFGLAGWAVVVLLLFRKPSV